MTTDGVYREAVGDLGKANAGLQEAVKGQTEKGPGIESAEQFAKDIEVLLAKEKKATDPEEKERIRFEIDQLSQMAQTLTKEFLS